MFSWVVFLSLSMRALVVAGDTQVIFVIDVLMLGHLTHSTNSTSELVPHTDQFQYRLSQDDPKLKVLKIPWPLECRHDTTKEIPHHKTTSTYKTTEGFSEYLQAMRLRCID